MNNTTTKRTFIIGEEWFFFKLYTGVKTADDILIKHLAPLINKWKQDRLISKWFFIRYYDPDFHLRVRLQLNDTNHLQLIITDLKNCLSELLSQKIIWKIQIDTYVRELERYGFDTIDDAETIFCIDSETILSILNDLDETLDDNYRWLAGIYLTNKLLDTFKISLEDKKELIEKYINAFKDEMGYNKFLKRQLDTKYRNTKKNIRGLLSNETNYSFATSIKNHYHFPTSSINNILNNIQDKDILENIIFSLSHMTLNRLFRSKSRQNEFVIYYMLSHHYKSVIAQNKYNKVS
ncbi:thiopeptide-type bacteriocin biosynthesis protein [Bernardetia sp. OM2101]|uniref:thiopeptide-type bacteriocin biosynthesis protein n=1 Tax=Bernardetia sp. OM2101 TaxID=3344876 RepID=UPI0035CE9D93